MIQRETLENVQGNPDFKLFGVIPKYVPFTRSYNVAGKEILVVAGDRGGWNAIEPPLLRAVDAGCSVNVYFSATCGEQYANGKLQPDKRMIVESGSPDLIEMAEFFNNSDHHLTVIGSSQSEEGTKASLHALLLSHSAPKFGVQDMYGSSMPTLQMMDNALDCLCVSDEFARDMVLQGFPELGDRVVVTGGPQFDKTIEVKKNWKKDRRRLRQFLQVANSEMVFLVIGGLNGTVEMLELLETGIEQAGLSENAKVILRIHPRATDEDKRLVNGYMHATKRKWFVDFDHNLAPTSEDLLPAADFVLSGYSTTNYFGILYKMPGVVYVGTPAFKRDLKAEKGLDRPPEVEIGAGWYVQTGADMERVITTVRLGVRVAALLKMTAAQKKVASYNDGHATDRVWEQMQKLMAH
jgi:hypothetical protein